MVEVVDANDCRYQCVITAIICWLLGKLGKVSQKGKILNGFMKLDSWVHSFPEQHYQVKLR